MHREGWKLNPTTPLVHPFENGCLMLIVQFLTILKYLFHPFSKWKLDRNQEENPIKELYEKYDKN